MVFADIQPLGVLVEHGIDHVGKGFVGVEEAVATRQQIALQPALQGVLTEHFHHPSILGEFAAIHVFGVEIAIQAFLVTS
jgi:hypothetical protein